MSNGPTIILDTDPGVDDAFAILLALQHCAVLALTTVAGNVAVEVTTRNALRILELAGSDVPVYKGAAKPLHDNPLDAGAIHGTDGLGGVELPEPINQVEAQHAVDYLIEATKLHPEVTIVAVGPLTNIALAIRKDPTFADRIAGLTIMGGSATHGNVTEVAEFNIFADPEAAEEVFTAVDDIHMIGLNLTHQVGMDERHVDAFRTTGTKISHVLAEMLDGYLVAVRQFGFDRVFMHDPTAILAVSHPEIIGYEHRHVTVEVNGRHTRGMTVVDQRPTSPREPNVHVAVSVDAEFVVARVMELGT